MQHYLAISILCTAAVCLAAVAIVRGTRSSRKQTEEPPQHHAEFAQFLFAAAEAINFNSSRSVPQQTVKQVMATKAWNQSPEIGTELSGTHPSPRPRVNSRDQAPSPKRS